MAIHQDNYNMSHFPFKYEFHVISVARRVGPRGCGRANAPFIRVREAGDRCPPR